MPQALKKSKAKKIYVVNLMTKYGETNGFEAGDFITEVEKYLGQGVLDYVLINNKRPSPRRVRKYALERSTLVKIGRLPAKPSPVLGNFLRYQGFIRHDPDKLAKAIVSLI
jgi:uncharacterized cofD-like protein